MNRLDTKTRAQIVACLVEGMSIRATCHVTGAAKGTVLKLLAEIGEACDGYMDGTFRNLKLRSIQCDEVWSFCYAKDRNVPEHMKGNKGVGSIWTWTALDADTKLLVTYHVGRRDARCANHFMLDLASRLATRVQLTTDGYKAYIGAVGLAFDDIDYAMLIKLYGLPAGTDANDSRYSPPQCIGTEAKVVRGDPDPLDISTSYVERSNLTMRMSMRRLTRLTNGFSKKVENLEHAVALHAMHYNSCRVHMTLKETPAMAAGITSRVWTLADLIALLPEPRVAPWGSKSGRKPLAAAPDSN